MKLAVHALLLLCFLLLSGGGQAHAHTGQEVVKGSTKSVSIFAADGRAFLSAPLQSQKEAYIIAILEDGEDRDEEEELFENSKPKAGVAHGVLCVRPRAPGINLHRNSPTRYCKHFAWSSVDRLIVMRVFRV